VALQTDANYPEICAGLPLLWALDLFGVIDYSCTLVKTLTIILSLCIEYMLEVERFITDGYHI